MNGKISFSGAYGDENRDATRIMERLLCDHVDPRLACAYSLKRRGREVMVVDSGALCTPDPKRFTYTRVRRPIWPLDEANESYAP